MAKVVLRTQANNGQTLRRGNESDVSVLASGIAATDGHDEQVEAVIPWPGLQL